MQAKFALGFWCGNAGEHIGARRSAGVFGKILAAQVGLVVDERVLLAHNLGRRLNTEGHSLRGIEHSAAIASGYFRPRVVGLGDALSHLLNLSDHLLHGGFAVRADGACHGTAIRDNIALVLRTGVDGADG